MAQGGEGDSRDRGSIRDLGEKDIDLGYNLQVMSIGLAH